MTDQVLGPGLAAGGISQQAGGSVFDSIQHLMSLATAPGNSDTLIRVICFIFVVFSIDQFFLQALSVSEPFENRYPHRFRDTVLKTAIVAAGIAAYLVTDREEVPTAIMLAYLIAGLYSVIRTEDLALRRAPVIIAVLFPVFACMLALAVPAARFTGLALAIMYLVLYIEFHTYVETQLTAREAQLAESRIRLMNEQITSHFAFNSLKVIEDMCSTDPVKAGQAIDAFARYLRSDLENITAPGMIPFEDELEHTKQYIRLEQLEGSTPFDVCYDIAVSDFRVPPLVLEPLAENAVRHGVKECGADTVAISTCETDGRVLITVSDNGNADLRKGLSPGMGRKRRSVALENIRNRLALQCEGKLDIIYGENGTAATISIPQTETGIYLNTK